MNNDTPTASYRSASLQRAALLAMSCAVGLIGIEAAPEYSSALSAINPVMSYGYGPPRGTPSRGKVRDTAPKPKPRKKERRSARHTQRRRR